jgi:putative DNA primase/helicase
MSSRTDTGPILAAVNIVDVCNDRIGPLKREGDEYVGKCPFHNDKNPSFKVNKVLQLAKCFGGCSYSGDAIDFIQKFDKITFHEAIKVLQDNYSAPRTEKEEKPASDWVPLMPVPATAPEPTFTHYKYNRPADVVYRYTNGNGKVMGYVCRFNLPDGKKDVLPYTYCQKDGKGDWRWKGFNKPRPIYNAHALKVRHNATVIIVEGEKAADYLQARLEKPVVISWPGGTAGVKYVDWSALKGRKVILWPDNDYSHTYGDKHALAGQLRPWAEQPGNAAMLEIMGLIQAPQFVKWIRNPEGTFCGWDVADSGWDSNGARTYILDNTYEYSAAPPVDDSAPELPLNEAPAISSGATPPDDADPEQRILINSAPFRFLGYSKNDGSQNFHFFTKGSKIVREMAASEMSKNNLYTLAPVNYWEKHFPQTKGFDLNAAVNWLIGTSNEKGIFSDALIRGRGAWYDDGRAVLHAGNHIISDGKPYALGSFETKYIYEAGAPLGLRSEKPVTTKQANRLVEMLELANWERPIDAYLLAGWCVVAPICGALNWRPHIWLTGGAGAGKTWVFHKVVRPLLGDAAIAVQSETTEPGIRQMLQHDALPIVFDEAEPEDAQAADRIAKVLGIMRASSADDGGIIAKGTSGGTSKTYRIRSCFAFASISVPLKNQSDRTRVTVLSMKPSAKNAVADERWLQLQRLQTQIITDDFIHGLQARTISLMPIIRENSKVFAAAAAAVIGEQRAGDQLGALLAGAYTLFSDKAIKFDEALKWVKERDWSEEKNNKSTRDEVSLFNYLMGHITRVDGGPTVVERPIGELLLVAANKEADRGGTVTQDGATNRLRRLGFKVDGEYIVISNTDTTIVNLLKNTAWSKNHNKILMRLEGAEAVDSTKFASGVKSRAVRVPITLLTN